MPPSNSTISESPSTGLPNAAPTTVAIMVSIVPSRARPPTRPHASHTRSSALRLNRAVPSLAAVFRRGGQQVVEHLLARQAALVHLADPQLVHRLHCLDPALALAVVEAVERIAVVGDG